MQDLRAGMFTAFLDASAGYHSYTLGCQLPLGSNLQHPGSVDCLTPSQSLIVPIDVAAFNPTRDHVLQHTAYIQSGLS